MLRAGERADEPLASAADLGALVLDAGVVELAFGSEPRLQADDHPHRVVLAFEPLELGGGGTRVGAVDRREPVRDRDLRRPGRAGFGGRGNRREQDQGEDGDRPREPAVSLGDI